jgi:hypothetical protein
MLQRPAAAHSASPSGHEDRRRGDECPDFVAKGARTLSLVCVAVREEEVQGAEPDDRDYHHTDTRKQTAAPLAMPGLELRNDLIEIAHATRPLSSRNRPRALA